MRTRRVLLLVQNVPWMADYHGREAGLVGQTVPAVELDDEDPDGTIGYVDDRDGEASEYADALDNVGRTVLVGGPEATIKTAGQYAKIVREMRTFAGPRLLHGMVKGVRT